MAYTQLIKLPEVMTRTSKSRSAIYQSIKDGTFPKQVNLGPRSVGWISDEVDAWIQSRIDASRLGNSS